MHVHIILWILALVVQVLRTLLMCPYTHARIQQSIAILEVSQ